MHVELPNIYDTIAHVQLFVSKEKMKCSTVGVSESAAVLPIPVETLPHRPSSWLPPHTWSILQSFQAAGPHPPLLVLPYSATPGIYNYAFDYGSYYICKRVLHVPYCSHNNPLITDSVCLVVASNDCAKWSS